MKLLFDQNLSFKLGTQLADALWEFEPDQASACWEIY